jgi:hypothetical protein
VIDGVLYLKNARKQQRGQSDQHGFVKFGPELHCNI